VQTAARSKIEKRSMASAAWHQTNVAWRKHDVARQCNINSAAWLNKASAPLRGAALRAKTAYARSMGHQHRRQRAQACAYGIKRHAGVCVIKTTLSNGARGVARSSFRFIK